MEKLGIPEIVAEDFIRRLDVSTANRAKLGYTQVLSELTGRVAGSDNNVLAVNRTIAISAKDPGVRTYVSHMIADVLGKAKVEDDSEERQYRHWSVYDYVSWEGDLYRAQTRAARTDEESVHVSLMERTHSFQAVTSHHTVLVDVSGAKSSSYDWNYRGLHSLHGMLTKRAVGSKVLHTIISGADVPVALGDLFGRDSANDILNLFCYRLRVGE